MNLTTRWSLIAFSFLFSTQLPAAWAADELNMEGIPLNGNAHQVLGLAFEGIKQAPPPAPIPGEVAKERTISVIPPIPAETASDEEWAAFVKGLTPNLQDQVVAFFAKALKRLHGEASAKLVKEPTGSLENFRQALRFAEFLLKYDPENGHGLYYSGDIPRYITLLEKTAEMGSMDAARGSDAFIQTIRASHDPFAKFLAVAAGIPELSGQGADRGAAACYSDRRGFCAQRAGWICHRMALDYWDEAQRSQVPSEKLTFFVEARNKSHCAVHYYPPEGFTQHLAQPSPSSALAVAAQEQIAALCGENPDLKTLPACSR